MFVVVVDFGFVCDFGILCFRLLWVACFRLHFVLFVLFDVSFNLVFLLFVIV